ncbi:hypothetical protein AHMF7605_10515 [Adhaeribacter arboris]|uniref:Uncharacterized protein n=2 Tax=Adhaeribacter arboris TaxID=2072846 RepID=A0A2T2YEI3_9BACT|nr:hypothetical protein AHMF7605_10515 [Adhaeribacter arboris]
MNEPSNPPQLVLNPFSHRHINMRPFFLYLHERRHDNPDEIAEHLEATIRFVSLNFDSEETDSLELKNTLTFLFQLKDVFANLSEFKNT